MLRVAVGKGRWRRDIATSRCLREPRAELTRRDAGDARRQIDAKHQQNEGNLIWERVRNRLLVRRGLTADAVTGAPSARRAWSCDSPRQAGLMQSIKAL